MHDTKDKKARLQLIRMIVSNQAVASQYDLLEELDKAGFSSTQTTLSRDLKQLRISKVRARNGKSVYVLPNDGQHMPAPKQREEVSMTRWGVMFSGNLMVVHTPPGHASMVAYDIDCAREGIFLGTVAGDDTVIVVMAEGAERADATRRIQKIIPSLHGKVKFKDTDDGKELTD
ncbi:MAG: arginine repressor [Bacteroidaceae bacterium]|nr:arginine repressor [Bacteroidaceae bacterium]